MALNRYVSGAVEGIVDDAVLRRMFDEVGLTALTIYNAGGKQSLRQRIRGFNLAARYADWVVVADLDHEFPCANEMVQTWLPRRNRRMRLRVAVREIESWLLSDRERLARFLAVPVSRIPLNPDEEDDPKRLIVDVARRSTKRAIREGMVPRPRSGRSVGTDYTALMIEFAQRWNVRVACQVSSSLDRTVQRLGEIGV